MVPSMEVEIFILEANPDSVMPAQAGIQVRIRCKFTNRLDSGLRRNDDK